MRKQGKKLSYSDAGVHIGEAGNLLREIGPAINKTSIPGVLGNIGGFSAFFQPDLSSYSHPVLLATTDGVGTKLKVALKSGKLDTIGIDLVAMCVNDLVVHGGTPLFFLDYYATGTLKASSAAKVIRGIAKGCIEGCCALIGGETAEMPSLYSNDDFDLAGFCVGVADKDSLITGKTIEAGDVIMGIPSKGFHSNGYSLLRKALFKKGGLTLSDTFPGTKSTLSKVLLTPTRIYVKPVLAVIKKIEVRGMAHITGGGLYDNIGRILPPGLKAIIQVKSMRVPSIFKTLQTIGNIDREEMFRTFNMGTGMVMVIRKENVKIAEAILREFRLIPKEIGFILPSTGNENNVEIRF